MVTYPYIVKTSSLRAFLKKIPELNVPETITQDTLSELGYKSSNDRPIVPILKFINFLDQSGKPTENYTQFRSTKGGATMAACIKNAYKDLFNLYSDAQSKDEATLKDFFTTRIKAGARVIEATIETFKVLCEYADFQTVGSVVKQATKTQPGPETPSAPVGLTINLNIQLQLPATEDASIYEKIFQSLRKHILEQ